MVSSSSRLGLQSLEIMVISRHEVLEVYGYKPSNEQVDWYKIEPDITDFSPDHRNH